MRHSILVGVVTAVIAALGRDAAAQVSLTLPVDIDITASTAAFATDDMARNDVAKLTSAAAIGTGCASAPVTADSAVWSITVYARPAQTGAIPIAPGTPPYILPAQPNHLFVPVVTTVSGDLNVRVRDHDFHGGATTKGGMLVISFGPMTLSEAADFVDSLPGLLPTLNTGLGQMSVTMTTFDIPVMAPAGAAWNAATAAPLYLSSVLIPTNGDVTAIPRVAAAAAAPMPAETQLPLGPIAVADLDKLKAAVRTLRDVRPDNAFFIVDEPCLQFAVSPFVAPTDGASGTTTSATALSFRGRYDFYSAAGTGFLKFRAEGDGAPSGSYYNRLEGTADFGMNRAFRGTIVSLGGSGAYAVKRDGETRIDTLRGTAKAKWQGPSLAGVFGSLVGSGTNPLASGEFGFITGNGALNQPTDWIARIDFTLTGRFTQRMSIDVKAYGAMAGAPRFGGLDRYGYRAVQFRYNVNKDWDYLIRYECGRKDPDYQNFCGSQSGLAMTVGR